jgi:hypothetical protein
MKIYRLNLIIFIIQRGTSAHRIFLNGMRYNIQIALQVAQSAHLELSQGRKSD